MKEFERISKSSSVADGTFSVALADDNLFEWDLHYYKYVCAGAALSTRSRAR